MRLASGRKDHDRRFRVTVRCAAGRAAAGGRPRLRPQVAAAERRQTTVSRSPATAAAPRLPPPGRRRGRRPRPARRASRRMPSPRTSISPASVRRRPHQQRGHGEASRCTRSSPTSRANGSSAESRGLRSARARAAICRRRTARGSARRARRPARRRHGTRRSSAGHHIAGSRTMKRAPSTFGALAVGAACHAVLYPEAAAMGFDDLLARSTGRGRNSGRTPGAAGRCRSARKSFPSRPASTPGPSSSTMISTSFAAAGR